MSLQEVQKILAQLYTNESFRNQFRTTPETIFKSVALTVEEQDFFKNLDPQQLDFFARSLKSKRLHEVRKILPITTQLLSKDFNRYFEEYSQTFLPYGNRKHYEDAVAFVSFLFQKMPHSLESRSRYLREAIRYEQTWLKVQAGTPCCIVQCYHYPISLLSRPHSFSENIFAKSRFIALWIRFFRYQKVLHWIL